VVFSVAALYYYLAPSNELPKVSKSLIRITKGKREIEYLALANIATMASKRPVNNIISIYLIVYYQAMFENSIAEFFIKPSDPNFCKMLKLEILTHLVNQDNINKLLQEFKVLFFAFFN
jgi:AP-3 complex subunit beta